MEATARGLGRKVKTVLTVTTVIFNLFWCQLVDHGGLGHGVAGFSHGLAFVPTESELRVSMSVLKDNQVSSVHVSCTMLD